MPDPTAPPQPNPAPGVFLLPTDDPHTHADPNAHAGDWSEPLLRQNATWFCQLRWLVVAALTLVGIAPLLPHPILPFALQIPPAGPLAAATLLALLNLLFQHWARTSQQGRFPKVSLLLWLQIVSDLLILTAVVHWVHRDWPAAPFMYLFHLILACIVFPPTESLLVAALAATFYLSSLTFEAAGWIHPPPALTPHTPTTPSILAVTLPMFIVWAVIWYLASRLAETVRRRDRELAITNRRLEASSEERARHMLQTTHQLKAPFAAIHAQAQLLEGGYCGPLPDPAQTVVQKISARCLALSRQIQEMLQLANLRSQAQLPLAPRQVHLDQALDEVLARLEPAARLRGIQIQRQLNPALVTAIPDHLAMLLENLVLNAIHYSHNHSTIEVHNHTSATRQPVVVVRDHGIGIPKDKLPRIFDDYYRTEEAVQHNRASTGLGLAVVRHVARLLHARIQVESAPGWGTRFTVHFPTLPPTP
jgi:signal transduction histidine kinase